MTESYPTPPDKHPAEIRAAIMERLWEDTKDFIIVNLALGSMKLQINRTPGQESLFMDM